MNKKQVLLINNFRLRIDFGLQNFDLWLPYSDHETEGVYLNIYNSTTEFKFAWDEFGSFGEGNIHRIDIHFTL